MKKFIALLILIVTLLFVVVNLPVPALIGLFKALVLAILITWAVLVLFDAL
jgi:hypothetical protein